MSNQAEHLPSDKSPYKLTSRGNVAQASSMVNRMARRDPALYPLSFILVAAAAVTGYYFMDKAFTQPERMLTQRGMVNPWDSEDKQETTPGQVAAFKYRYKTRDGHMEDAYPIMNVDVRKLNDEGGHRYHT